MVWRESKSNTPPAPNELQELFVVELVLSGEMDRLAKRLSWRVAGKFESGNNDLGPESIAAERNRFLERSGTNEETLPVWLNAIGRDEGWFAQAVVMEALHRQKRDRLLSHRAREHEMAAMRLPLTRIRAGDDGSRFARCRARSTLVRV